MRNIKLAKKRFKDKSWDDCRI